MVNSSISYGNEFIHELLETKYKQHCTPDFLPEDPLGLVHEYHIKSDQEIIGLLVSTIAWGNRKSIISSGKKLMELFGSSPTEFVVNFRAKDLEKCSFVHRTFQKEDLLFFLYRLQNNYQTQ